MPLTEIEHAKITAQLGWCGPNKRELIHAAILRLQQRFGVVIGCEIGVYGGQSALAAALAMRGESRLFAVDPYLWDPDFDAQDVKDSAFWWGGSKDPPSVVMASAMKAFEGLPITHFRKRSQEALADVPAVLHYLHIDGDHAAASAKHDLDQYGSRVVQGGVVVIDDIDWPGVQTILPAVESRCKRKAMSLTKKQNCSAWAMYEVR